MILDQIRDLDGPGLTALTFSLGLAPLETVANTGPFREPHTCYTGVPDGSPWLPHLCLAQAHAVFRQLRTLGFCTEIHGYPHDPYAGSVQAWRYPGGQPVSAHFGSDTDEECVALLRVACLAVARLKLGEYT